MLRDESDDVSFCATRGEVAARLGSVGCGETKKNGHAFEQISRGALLCGRNSHSLHNVRVGMLVDKAVCHSAFRHAAAVCIEIGTIGGVKRNKFPVHLFLFPPSM
jgi:hypothetical protein